METNGVMMQYFHWYTPADGSLWRSLKENAVQLAAAGITSLWLPPAYKSAGGCKDPGYAVYDLFDLGEFDQKGTIPTRFGTREEYLAAIEAAHNAGLNVYADIVFNHKLGADHLEEINATPYDPMDRTKPIGDLQKISAWTHFTFPGRKGKYSELQWHWWHFNAVDFNVHDQDNDAVWLFEGKSFDDSVDLERGNFDYLMGCNLDLNNEDVQKELMYWGEWYLETTGVDGFRFDAVKHVKSDFFLQWLDHLEQQSGKELFAVGEYWSGNTKAADHFIAVTNGRLKLFDVGLHLNFAKAGKEAQQFDLRKIFDNTLVALHPAIAVTMVSNHDSQPLQSLESVVEAWFKPLAYAIILLRKDGYPCIFAADYYGAHYKDVGKDGQQHEIWMVNHQWLIDKFLAARKQFAWGEQYDYIDHPSCIGWTRTGTEDNPGGLAVIMSTSDAGIKHMETGYANTRYKDLTGHIEEELTTNEHGWGEFKCPPHSVSVWVAMGNE